MIIIILLIAFAEVFVWRYRVRHEKEELNKTAVNLLKFLNLAMIIYIVSFVLAMLFN